MASLSFCTGGSVPEPAMMRDSINQCVMVCVEAMGTVEPYDNRVQKGGMKARALSISNQSKLRSIFWSENMYVIT